MFRSYHDPDCIANFHVKVLSKFSAFLSIFVRCPLLASISILKMYNKKPFEHVSIK